MNLLTSSSTRGARQVRVTPAVADGETLGTGVSANDGSVKHGYHGWHLGVGMPLSVDHLDAETGDRSTIITWNVVAAVRQLRVEASPPCC